MPEVVGRLRPPRISAAPASPAVGEVYYDTVQNQLFWWNGTNWIPSSAGSDVAAALSTPVLRGEAGGGLLGGATAGSYLCNMDSTPKVPGTLGNQVLSWFQYIPALDDPPPGFKTQWQLEATVTSNTTAPGGTLSLGLLEVTGISGGAGGYVETTAGSFASPTAISQSMASPMLTTPLSGWHDSGVVGDIVAGKVYAFACFISGTLAANSGVRWRMRLWRRFVLTGGSASSINIRPPTRTVYTSGSGTYTPPAGCSEILVECIGGGGGGAGAPATVAGQLSGGGSGGGGAYASSLIASPAASYAYAVGAGGSAGSGSTTNGGTGGDSTFGASVVVAKGGSGGTFQGPTGVFPAPLGPAAGGSSASCVGQVVFGGSGGAWGALYSTTFPGYGGPGGPAARGGGSSANGPGAGASGTASNQNAAATGGAAGFGGLIVITEFYGAVGMPRITSGPFASGPPATPADGDLWNATNVDANGTVWQFRYNAGSASAYKWEFVGGPPVYTEIMTSETTTSTTYANLATIGPQFNLARGGDYVVQFGCNMWNATAGGNTIIGLYVGAAPSTDHMYQTSHPASQNLLLGSRPVKLLSLAAATLIAMQYKVTSGTGNFGNRSMAITPVRVS